MTAVATLAGLLEQDSPPLDRCMLLIGEALGSNPNAVADGLAALDHLASDVAEPTVDALVEHLFVRHDFRGDSVDYHSPENSFLDRVIDRRLGMPITLSTVFISVAARVGVNVHGVGMPGHFLVRLDEGQTFLDAFAGGKILTVDQVRAGFHERFSPDVGFPDELLLGIGTAAIVSRTLNNLVRTYFDRDSHELGRLIELRAQLPGPRSERHMVIGLAESRARWDIGANVREVLDPDDPMISMLRARMN